jgi:hypothetical protein
MKPRLVASLLFFFASAFSLFADSPSLLATAVQKLADDDDCWAYTQVYRRTDQEVGETVARFDPSKPAGSQWQLIKYRGRTPTASEAERYCQRRAKEGNRSDGRAVADLLDVDHATVTEQSVGKIRYEVPLKKSAIGKVPTENFVVYADVDPVGASLQRFIVVLKQSIRLLGGIAEIQSASGEVQFQSLDESESSRPTFVSASGTGQALFKKMNRSAEIIFKDQRRVKS